jgi:hypothetical protein
MPLGLSYRAHNLLLQCVLIFWRKSGFCRTLKARWSMQGEARWYVHYSFFFPAYQSCQFLGREMDLWALKRNWLLQQLAMQLSKVYSAVIFRYSVVLREQLCCYKIIVEIWVVVQFYCIFLYFCGFSCFLFPESFKSFFFLFSNSFKSVRPSTSPSYYHFHHCILSDACCKIWVWIKQWLCWKIKLGRWECIFDITNLETMPQFKASITFVTSQIV